MDITELSGVVSGEVTDSEADLEAYSHDASVFEIKPQAIVKPKNAEDLQKLVKWAAAQKPAHPDLSLTARSAGTDMGGGAINDSVIVDFTAHFNRIIQISGDGHAVTEPGVYYRDFEKATLEKGWILPCYTASKSLNTVGGMAANNSAGEKSLTYGQTKDYVEELDVVLSDGSSCTMKKLTEEELDQKIKLPNFEGKIYRQVYELMRDHYDIIRAAKPKTSKNSAGYRLWEVWDKKYFDLSKLLVGSQGTLGLITKIKYRLVRPKPKSELLVMFLKDRDFPLLGEIVHAVTQCHPESFESFDDHTFKLAMRFLPDMIRHMKGSVIKLGFDFLPELWMTLSGGVPKLILIAEFTGESDEEIIHPLLAAKQAVERQFHLKTHITRTEEETQKYWTVRRESFNLLRQHTKGRHTAPFIDDIVVRPEQLPQFLPELNKILAKYPSLIYTIAGHAGDANFHIIPLMDMRQPAERAIIPKLSDEVYSLVLSYGGSITAEHNDGLIRTPYLEKMYGHDVYELFKKIKQIFDPQDIFNPRKKVGATLEYVMEHMRRD